MNPVNKCLFIFLIEGHLNIGSENLHTLDAVGIWEAADIEIQCNETSDFLIIETP